MDNLNYAKSYHTNIRLCLDNIKELLDRLGNPHKNMKYIHIAGTNGKGSVCSFLEEILVSANKKTGRFSSPELIKRNETIRVNKNDITDDELSEILKDVHQKASDMKPFPSPYEILCAAAFIHFKKSGCDYVILEAGMGGEGDATNIIDLCEIAIITGISYDHTAYLGNTISEIAAVKSGIIKKGCRFITPEANLALDEVFKQKCLERNAELNYISPLASTGFEDIYETVTIFSENIKLSLGGDIQRENAALAVEAAKILKINKENIIYGLSNAKNPARFEELFKNIYFDGAHNPSGAEALKKSLERYMPHEKKAFIMGVMKDKDFKKMLEILNDGNSSFYFTDVFENERAMPKEEMKEVAKKLGICATTVPDIKVGIETAKLTAKKIILCGSLYMYKQAVFIKKQGEYL